MYVTIKEIERKDLGLKWDFTAMKSDEKEGFLVRLWKLEKTETTFPQFFPSEAYDAIHEEFFVNFWDANERYKVLLNYYEEFVK